MNWMKASYKILEIDLLKQHEALIEEYMKEFLEVVRRDGFLRKPVLVDEEHLVILDGHHRVEALRLLGCKRIPVYLVDYNDDAIVLALWPGAVVSEVKKEDVIERGLKGDIFPPKTTKHIVKDELKEVRVYLKDLV
ncbi:MAG: ParB N-terminal domain-containing protein [Thermoplasmata archaeon]|nr:ParB N-terminal domain-containing protein [Thermoplasmata archaeon]